MTDQGYPKVGGRLRQFYDVWKCLTNDNWILQAVSGYRIEFEAEPVQRKAPGKIGFSKAEQCSIDIEI